MRWASWLGRLFALSWLVLLWPVLGAFFHLKLSVLQVTGLSTVLAGYAGVYAFFCFWGYRRRDPPFVVAEVAVLSLLALALNEISGQDAQPVSAPADRPRLWAPPATRFRGDRPSVRGRLDRHVRRSSGGAG